MNVRSPEQRIPPITHYPLNLGTLYRRSWSRQSAGQYASIVWKRRRLSSKPRLKL